MTRCAVGPKLRSRAERDAAAFRKRKAVAAKWNTHPHRHSFVKAALDVLQALLPQSCSASLANDDVLVMLSDGSALCLCLLASGEVNGVASRSGETHIAAVHDGAPRALFELAAALWTDPRFCSHIGDAPLRQRSVSMSSAVPRGLEYVATIANQPWESDSSIPMSSPLPMWLLQDLSTLQGVRKMAFERTFCEGVRFLFWHEIAHVCCGHLGSPAAQARQFGELIEFAEKFAGEAVRGLSESRPPSDLLRAFEIEADRFALDRLFGEAILRERRSSQSGGGHGNLEVLLTVLGAALVPMVFHARRMFCDKPEAAVSHPPLWFRADDILRAETFVQERMSSSTADPGYALRRFQERGQLEQALLSIGELHPMLGQWFGPLAFPDRESEAKAVLEEAEAAMKKHVSLAHLPRTVPALVTQARNKPCR